MDLSFYLSMIICASAVVLVSAAYVLTQQAGTNIPEVHPKLTWQRCTQAGGCAMQTNASITMDANYRWIAQVNSTHNCYTLDQWDVSLCPDDVSCAANCALEGMDYTDADNGVYTSGNQLRLKLTNRGRTTDGGSRVYLMSSDSQYEVFKLPNQEFAFDVDLSLLPCGLNGAVHFLEMDADGGVAKNPGNKAGAKYGTGYCDATCPRNLKFINGQANVEGWTASATSETSGTGRYGACCNQVSVWDANSYSESLSLHPCSTFGLQRCADATCGTTDPYSTVCDPDGCDFNPYRLGNKTFFGQSQTIDTRSKVTVVTQFITSDGTSTGQLSEVRRLYVQGGRLIQNAKVNIAGIDPSYNSVSDNFCTAEKTAFGEVNQFQNKGGLTQLGKAMANGMVLALSIWDDSVDNMLWLDSIYPPNANTSQPGVVRGSCSTGSGKPADLEVVGANYNIIFSNIRFGDIGSTYSATSA